MEKDEISVEDQQSSTHSLIRERIEKKLIEINQILIKGKVKKITQQNLYNELYVGVYGDEETKKILVEAVIDMIGIINSKIELIKNPLLELELLKKELLILKKCIIRYIGIIWEKEN